MIALIGRSSVGKSTLFNKFTKSTVRAITAEVHGVTRDYRIEDASIDGREFIVADTPGIESIIDSGKSKDLQTLASQKSLEVIKRANAVLFLVDGKVGITPTDEEVASFLRKNQQNVILVVNKCEKNIILSKEYYALGFKDIVTISAAHSLGFKDLAKHMEPFIKPHKNYIQESDYEEKELEDEVENEFDDGEENEQNNTQQQRQKSFRISIVGRPNSGKSTYINALLKENRLLTSEIAGTTRDSIDIKWNFDGKNITLVDTAGLRRKSKINEQLEQFSCSQSVKSIAASDCVILMVDASLGVHDQDLKIANLAIDKSKCLVIILNKWDLVKNKTEYIKYFEHFFEHKLSQIKKIPVCYISAININNLLAPIKLAHKVWEKAQTKIPTSMLNQWIEYATLQNPLPSYRPGKLLKIKYCTQISQAPLKFKFFTNVPGKLPENYKTYLLNSLKQNFGLEEVIVQIEFTSTKNPYKEA